MLLYRRSAMLGRCERLHYAAKSTVPILFRFSEQATKHQNDKVSVFFHLNRPALPPSPIVLKPWIIFVGSPNRAEVIQRVSEQLKQIM